MNEHVFYRSRLISLYRVCKLHFLNLQELLHNDCGSLSIPNVHIFNVMANLGAYISLGEPIQ